jgi:hypothetical protein
VHLWLTANCGGTEIGRFLAEMLREKNISLLFSYIYVDNSVLGFEPKDKGAGRIALP